MKEIFDAALDTITAELALSRKYYMFGLYSNGFTLLIALLWSLEIAPGTIKIPTIGVSLPSSYFFIGSVLLVPVFGSLGAYFLHQSRKSVQLTSLSSNLTNEYLSFLRQYVLRLKQISNYKYIILIFGEISTFLIGIYLSLLTMTWWFTYADKAPFWLLVLTAIIYWQILSIPFNYVKNLRLDLINSSINRLTERFEEDPEFYSKTAMISPFTVGESSPNSSI